jgi:SAM-dependent methyltransferase
MSSKYIHGTDAEEQARLSLMNDLLNARELPELGLRAGEKILEVGLGLGQFARAMSRAVGPSGRVTGIERSEGQIAEACRLAQVSGETGLVEIRQGTAETPPLTESEWGSFDLAHARYLLEHVRDPLAVVRQMARAVRRGGRVVLADDDHAVFRVHPEPPAFRAAWEAFQRCYDRNGNDAFVGRRLPDILHQAGLSPRRATWIFFGACAGESTFGGFVRNLQGNLASARDAIVETGALDAPMLDRALDEIGDLTRRPGAAIWYAMCWAEGVKV